jgi:hypothetical protein
VVVKDTTIEGGRKQYFDLKVFRHYPLVLLIEERLESRVN